MSIRPSGDTARGLVFDDFVDKQVVHVSATSFRSGAERVSMGLIRIPALECPIRNKEQSLSPEPRLNGEC